MKIKLLLSFVLISYLSAAQVDLSLAIEDVAATKRFQRFTQFEISIPLQGNKNRGEILPNGSTNDSWFVPDGINSNFGYGIMYKEWIGLSANSGISMKLSEKLVIAPIFFNLRIMPKINDEAIFGIDIGLGQSFALGRGNLSGTFRRMKLNFGDFDSTQVFIEVVSYGMMLNNNSQDSISLGISLVSF